MILGLDDIAGGSAIAAFIIWLGLSGLFYLVCYAAALNVIDDQTGNSWLKIPAMWFAALPSAGLMAVFGYKPLVLIILMGAANYFRVKKRATPKTSLPLLYIASYGYLALMLGLTYYLPSFVKSTA